MNRSELETLTKKTISADMYYDLCDTIDSVTDEELIKIIACNGDYEQELELVK